MEKDIIGKRIINFVFLGVPIILAIVINLRDKNRNVDIDVNTAKTKAIVTKVHYGRSPYIDWEYNVDGIIYEGSALDTRSFNFVEYSPGIGDTFEVEYSKENPQNSRLILQGMKSYR